MFLLKDNRFAVMIGALLLVPAIAILDLATGARFSLSLLYVLPIALAVFASYPGPGIGVALLCVAADSGVAFAIAQDDQTVVAWTGVAVRGGVFVVSAACVAWFRRDYEMVKALAGTDTLTGLKDRSGFLGLLESEIARTHRSRVPFTVAVIDVDKSRNVAEQQGEAAHERALRKLAVLVSSHARASDTIGRIAEDQFALFLPDTRMGGATQLLNKIRIAINRDFASGKFPMTCGIGAISFAVPPPDASTLMQMEISLMHEVKKKGRNGFLCEDVPDTVESMLRGLSAT